MNLMCCETESLQRAYPDPTLLKDIRVLNNLLQIEERFLPSTSYFKCVQTDIKSYMRKMVARWMLEVCEEQKCEEDVFPLSMNYLDRFLSVVNLHRNRLQLLGATCMFIASKLKESNPVSAEKLVIYTDNSVTLQDLMEMELLVLSKLKWDVSAVTPHDFLDQIISRLSLHKDRPEAIKTHAQTFIALCATDCKFMLYPPSMIASASVGAAVQGLQTEGGHVNHSVLPLIHKITGIDIDCLRACQDLIEQTLAINLIPNQNLNNKTEPDNELPTTPTDAHDIHF